MPRAEALLKGEQRGTPAVEQDRRGRVQSVGEEARLACSSGSAAKSRA